MKKKIAWLLMISMFISMFLPWRSSNAQQPIKSLPVIRTTHPGVDPNNPYYGRNNKFWMYHNNGSNCTWYAFGRVSELLGGRAKDCLQGNGGMWFENNKSNPDNYPYGQEPRLGAIACWAGGKWGHVAVVEEIYPNGNISFTESHYPIEGMNLPKFRIVYNTPPASYFGGFQGYIYPFSEDHFGPKESDPLIKEGEYRIVSNVGEDKVVEVDPTNSDNGANVRLGVFDGGDHQKWILKKNDEDKTFQVISAATGKVLDVKNGGTSNGANIHVWNYEGLDNQKWYVMKSNVDGWYNFIAKHSGLVMDVENSKNIPATNIQQYYRDFTIAQNFRLEPFQAPTPKPEPSGKSRDVILTLDVSGSMAGDSLNNTKKAATRFIESLLGKSTNTRIGIVTYETDVQVVSELTYDKEALLAAVNSLTDLGGTNIYGGLEASGNILENSPAEEKAIVIMTDGEANEGKTMPPETIVTEDGTFEFDEYETAIYHLAEEYKDLRGYKIYSMGFGLSEDSSAYRLMKYISSLFSGKRAFWSINNENVDDIVFSYEDIADTIDKKDRILIRIHCPVDVEVVKNGESLNRNSLTSSFGRVIVSPVEDGHQYLFSLNYDTDYRISVQGTGDGTMDFNLTYKVGEKEDNRAFVAIPISAVTKIHADTTDLQQNFTLFEDQNGDGIIDQKWIAGENEVINTPSPYEEEVNPKPDRIRQFIHYTLNFETDGGTTLSSVTETKGRKIYLDDYVPKKSGYVFDGWYLEPTFITKVTFITFNKDKTIYAKWTPVTPSVTSVTPVAPVASVVSSLPFTDVKNGDWFQGDVEYVWKHGIMNGLTSSTFGAYDSTTRAMIVTVLWRMEQEPISNQVLTFKDVSEKSYYTGAVRWAVENGIIKGYNEMTFGSDDSITLEQMAAIIHRYAKMKGWNMENGNVADGKQYLVSPYALSSVQWANSNNMLKGIHGNTLIGNINASRAQIAACLHQLSYLKH